MAKTAVDDYSASAASNTDIDGLDSTGATGLVKSGDNYTRSMMAHLKAKANDQGGVNTVGGTGDAITVTLAAALTAIPDGYRFTFNAPAANTGAATITVTNSAAVVIGTNIKIRKWVAGVETALSANDIAGAGSLVEVIYDTARDTGTGAFMLAHPATAITFATNAQAVTGTSTVLSVNPNNLSAVRQRRNRIVNPAMQVSQENGNTSGTTTGYYIADQFAMYRVTSAGTITGQRVQSQTIYKSKDRARITITAADASLAAGEYLTLNQNIEGQEVADFAYGAAGARQAVLRFGFKGPAGTYAVSLKNSALNRSYVKTFSPTSANTDEMISLVIPGDTSGTWLTDTGIGISLDFVLAAGSTFQGTDAVWQAGNILGTAAVSNGMGTIAQVFEIFDVGLYIDPESTGVAPPWELPDYDDTLRQCQRYWECAYASSVAIGAVVGGFLTGTTWACSWKYAAQKRAIPTMSLGSGASWSGSTPGTVTSSIDAAYISSATAFFYATNTSGSITNIANSRM